MPTNILTPKNRQIVVTVHKNSLAVILRREESFDTPIHIDIAVSLEIFISHKNRRFVSTYIDTYTLIIMIREKFHFESLYCLTFYSPSYRR